MTHKGIGRTIGVTCFSFSLQDQRSPIRSPMADKQTKRRKKSPMEQAAAAAAAATAATAATANEPEMEDGPEWGRWQDVTTDATTVAAMMPATMPADLFPANQLGLPELETKTPDPESEPELTPFQRAQAALRFPEQGTFNPADIELRPEYVVMMDLIIDHLWMLARCHQGEQWDEAQRRAVHIMKAVMVLAESSYLRNHPHIFPPAQ